MKMWKGSVPKCSLISTVDALRLTPLSSASASQCQLGQWPPPSADNSQLIWMCHARQRPEEPKVQRSRKGGLAEDGMPVGMPDFVVNPARWVLLSSADGPPIPWRAECVRKQLLVENGFGAPLLWCCAQICSIYYCLASSSSNKYFGFSRTSLIAAKSLLPFLASFLANHVPYPRAFTYHQSAQILFSILMQSNLLKVDQVLAKEWNAQHRNTPMECFLQGMHATIGNQKPCSAMG